MEEIVRINLDNEMDLILAHKRTMKLAEMCGLSVPSQTTFATAVSEIARTAIGSGKKSSLVLGISFLRANKKEITAIIFDDVDLKKLNPEAFTYAKKLMGEIEFSQKDNRYEIRLNHPINFSGTISEIKILTFKEYFKHEPPLSPYDEIRKKNILLIELSDKLRESENQYRILTDTLPIMMFAVNQRGDVTYSNKWLKDYIGVQNNFNFISWQSMVHPDDSKEIWKDWETSLQNKTVFRSQGRIKHKDKDKFTWHLISILPAKTDRETNWIGFFVDIHAQKLVEETLKDNQELKEAKAELERYQIELEKKIHELNLSNHDLEQFAYIASHDLQEPLRKIMTFSTLLENNLALDEVQKKYFSKITNSSERMSFLIRDVLNYSTISNKKDKFEKVDLNNVLDQIKIDYELLLQEKNAKIENGTLPVIMGIPLQLTQLFSNLISNSLKFSDKDPVITITCETATESEILGKPELILPVKHYKLTISDNGIGFDQQFADQIFTIFQRLNSRQKYEGTGIGLALCKRIVENHHGSICAKSTVNKGAIFNIILPEES